MKADMQESLSTPLTQAAENGQLQNVQQLLQNVDPKRRFETIQTEGIAALYKARANGYKDVFNILLGEIVKEFEAVAKASDLDRVQSLINSFETRSDKQMLMDNISPDIIVNVAAANQGRILHAMLKAASIKRRKELLCHNNFAPFYWAIKCKHNKMVEFILRVVSQENKQAMIQFKWEKVFTWALAPENIKHFEPLYRELTQEFKQSLIKQQDFLIFQWCAMDGFTQIVKLLLQEVNPEDKQAMLKGKGKFSAFYWAVCNGHVEIVELLLKEIAPDAKSDMLVQGALAAFDHSQERTAPLVVSMRVIELLFREAGSEDRELMIEPLLKYINAEVFKPVIFILSPLLLAYAKLCQIPIQKAIFKRPDGSPWLEVINRITVYQELITQGIYTGLEGIVNQKAMLKLVCRNVENMFCQLEVGLLSNVFSFLDINDFSSAVVIPASILSLRSKVQPSSAPKPEEETSVSLLDKFIGEMTGSAARDNNALMLSSASLLTPETTPAVSHLNSVQLLDQFIFEMEQSMGNGRSL